MTPAITTEKQSVTSLSTDSALTSTTMIEKSSVAVISTEYTLTATVTDEKHYAHISSYSNFISTVMAKKNYTLTGMLAMLIEAVIGLIASSTTVYICITNIKWVCVKVIICSYNYIVKFLRT